MMLEPLWGWVALFALRILVLVAEVVRGPGSSGPRLSLGPAR
jgi:hypothetical protein